MIIINKKTSELIPYEKNNKTHPAKQIDAIASSLKRFGFKQPLVIDSNNVLVVGHGRVEAAKQAGIEEIPCVLADDLSQEEIDEYRIYDNITAEHGETNIGNLHFELDRLENDELNDLCDYDPVTLDPEKETIEDNAPEAQEAKVIELGDIIQLGEHKIMCGDSTKIEDVEKVTEGVTISMVFSDPPYNIDYQDMTGTHKKIKNDKMSDEDFVQFLKDSIYPNCETQYVCCSWQYVHLFRRAMEESGLPVKSFIVWDKVNPAQNLDKYYKQHEIILYSGKFGGQKTVRGDVWTLKRQRNTVHPTMKPIELIEMALTDNRDMFKVYDAFLGSGSILIACEKTNRICYGMELDPKYIEVIIKRYHQYTDGKKDIKCLNREIDLEEVYGDNKIIPVGEAEDNHYGKTN